jgi:holo-[acyl-carrier protein] synthase
MGTDIAEVHRIREAAERYGKRFIERIFTPHEIAYAETKANKWERYAARFAAKEAGMKALGTGWRRGITWRDFQVTNAPSGRPQLTLTGRAAEFAAAMAVKTVTVSLTHTAEQAMAVVILEG